MSTDENRVHSLFLCPFSLDQHHYPITSPNMFLYTVYLCYQICKTFSKALMLLFTRLSVMLKRCAKVKNK